MIEANGATVIAGILIAARTETLFMMEALARLERSASSLSLIKTQHWAHLHTVSDLVLGTRRSYA